MALSSKLLDSVAEAFARRSPVLNSKKGAMGVSVQAVGSCPPMDWIGGSAPSTTTYLVA
jgi:hypothetical protein